MPATEFDTKKRKDRDVISYSEFTGLRNDVGPEHFESTDLAVANNVDLDKSRRLSRRAGATKRNALPAHSLWAGGDQSLFMSGTTLHRLNTDFTSTQLRTGLSGAAMSYARAGDMTFYNDGTRGGVVLAATTRTWGLDTPPLVGSIVAGNLTPGTYGFTATYVRDDGQESGARGCMNAVVAAGQSVAITIAASIDPGVTDKRIYMTAPNGEVLMHVATRPNDSTPFIPAAIDILAMNELLLTQWMGPPPAGQLIAYYKGRMFVAVGEVLYPSEPFAYELFDLRNYIQLDGPITMLAPMEDKSGDASGFFVGTSNSCGILTGGGPEEFKYTPKVDYGAALGALTFVDGSLYLDGAVGARMLPMWLSTQGICIGLPNLDISNLSRSTYSFTVGATGAALFDSPGNMFIGVTGANPAIVMQIENQTLTTYTEFVYNSFAHIGSKNFAASAAGVFELVGNSDNGAPIASTVTLGTTDFGSTFVKALDRLFIGYRSTADMTVQIVTDDERTSNYTLPISDQTALATQRVKVGKGLTGRYWQFAIKNINGVNFTLDTIDVKSAQLARRINGRA